MRLYFGLLLTAALVLSGCGASQSGSSNPTSVPTRTSSSTLALGQNHVHTIVIMPHNPNVIYMGAHYHLYKSSDGGVKWRPLVNQMMLSMALDPAHPSTLYAVSSKRGLLKTTDGGVHWRPSAAGIPVGRVTGVAVDSNSRAVFAYGLGIYRSVDGGVHWSNVLAGQSITNVAVGSTRTDYAAAGNGLFVSHDGGVHWKSVASVGNQPVIQVVASGSVAYAAAPIALLKSTNNGRTWSPLGNAPAGIEFLGLSPSNPREVIAEVAGKGFVASHDGGATWRPANSGIHDRNFNASTVRVAPSAARIVYTGSWGLHFYASHDGAQHWTETATLIR